MDFAPNLPIRLLVVDDDPQIRAMLAEYLSTFGMQADGVEGGAQMRRAMAAGDYDMVILDLSLPGESGLDLCRQLRAQTDVAVIMLTARAELADRVVGLEVGADDYATKPFEMRELVARIHTVLRRSRSDTRRAAATSGGHEREAGGLRVRIDLPRA
ncbi:response regulator transcription factor [Cupriavidus pinatubonensis]|uniref:Regulator of RpoS n=1 Tax=Cupriavidus pinatubonensis TaxID=248026 RepID=A0ABM8WSW9_9BURK|nr:Regulator of RpoS [Cupriavidus pinatubonensis]